MGNPGQHVMLLLQYTGDDEVSKTEREPDLGHAMFLHLRLVLILHPCVTLVVCMMENM